MRALILVAGAALAVSACSSNDNANNTMNVDGISTTDEYEHDDRHERDGHERDRHERDGRS